MKKRYLVFLSLFLSAGLMAVPTEAIKEKITSLESAVKNEKNLSKKSSLHYELALNFYEDQETDKAFENFLTALKTAPCKTSLKRSSGEEEIYKQALFQYEEEASLDPVVTAQNLISKYEEILKKHPDYLSLELLLATAYANLGQYDLFFKHFYAAYPYQSDHFLVYKTQGILNLRLSHAGKTGEERSWREEEACAYLCKALEKKPNDPSLYKVLVFMAKNRKDSELLVSCLNKMCHEEMKISRGDLIFYIHEAVDLKQIPLAEKLVSKGHTLYEYSRGLQMAEEYLNQHKR